MTQLPIFGSLKAISSLNREQSQSPLPRHHVILVACIAVASTPGRENARASLCGRLSVWNRTAPDRRHLLPVATTNWSCSVFKSWIPDTHCPFQWKWQVLHNYDISMLQQVDMFFNGIAWWRFRLCSSRSSLMSRWCNVPLVREFQMWRHRYKQRDSHWFQGRQMRFSWMWSTFSWKYSIIYPSRLLSANVMIPTLRLFVKSTRSIFYLKCHWYG